ncbi:MAG: hypothetical protein WD626_05935 [Bauldia sp.]
MFDDNPETKWFREFHELGADRVRGAIAGGGWDRDKKQAARRWLEKEDFKAWQAGRKGQPDRVRFKERMRQSKWWLYGVGAMLLLMGAGRLFRMF